MKTFKKLLLSASLLALAFAGTAHAQTYLRITGSTAYRAAVHQAILKLLGSNNHCAYNNSGTSGLAGANQAIFSGTYNSTSYIIKTDWTGSVGGIKALSQNLTLYSSGTTSAWLADSNLTSAAAGVAGSQTIDTTTFPGGGKGILNFKPTGGTNLNAAQGGPGATWETITNPPALADVGFSDCFQSTTAYASTNLGATGGTSATGKLVGLVDFIWVKSAAQTTDPDYTAWTHLTNVTPNVLKNLYAQGALPVALFTGNSADASSPAAVFAVGRDEDSGTRINAYAESYFGVNSGPQQYYLADQGTSPSAIGSSTTAADLELFPAQTVEGTSEPTGHSGFSSGGKVASEVSFCGVDPQAGGYLISYLGLDDATSALNATSSSTGYVPAAQLTWNGVTFSVAAVEQGQYSFWGYEHMYYRIGSITGGTPSQVAPALSGAAQTFADALGTDLYNVDSLVASGILIGNMNCYRTVEGGVINQGVYP